MSTHLEDLFDLADLKRAIEDGYVRTQVHPTLPLTIHNYAEKTAFERAWNPVTSQCRGLIAHTDTGQIVARPFRKAHNHNEPEAPTFDLDERVIVADKIDGSLGIGYPTGQGEYAIATRGSFASAQAIHATQVWNDRYAHRTSIPDGVTPLWEICYPANRIVVDYGDLDDLVLLGGIVINSGTFIDPRELAKVMHWAGPVVDEWDHYRNFGEVMATDPRPGREGFVVRSLDGQKVAKYKYDEYVYLHRIVTGMNERVVWEHLGNGGDLQELITPLPDEFHAWVHGVADRLRGEQEAIADAAQVARDELVAALPPEWTRKDYALAAVEYGPLRPYLFHLLDGRDPRPSIWKTLRPSGAVTMTGYTEEAA